MELKEFLEKFLPYYKSRQRDYQLSYFRDNPIDYEKHGLAQFCKFNFPEALQNFKELICKEQRSIFDSHAQVPTGQMMNEKEEKIIDLLVEAHNLFVELQEKHSMADREWCFYMNGLQGLIQHRICVRLYPEKFTN
jgi:hypothetical protein